MPYCNDTEKLVYTKEGQPSDEWLWTDSSVCPREVSFLLSLSWLPPSSRYWGPFKPACVRPLFFSDYITISKLLSLQGKKKKKRELDECSSPMVLSFFIFFPVTIYKMKDLFGFWCLLRVKKIASRSPSAHLMRIGDTVQKSVWIAINVSHTPSLTGSLGFP